jgi:hypothetical protein
MIYFVRCGTLDWIKIGSANDVSSRIMEIQAGSPFPLRLAAVMEGNRDGEIRLHRRFADERGHGEWFDLSPRLRKFILTKAIPATTYMLQPGVGPFRVCVLWDHADHLPTLEVEPNRSRAEVAP